MADLLCMDMSKDEREEVGSWIIEQMVGGEWVPVNVCESKRSAKFGFEQVVEVHNGQKWFAESKARMRQLQMGRRHRVRAYTI